MARQVPGSKVIICTDGMANVGLGSLEGIDSSEEARNQTETFYTTVSSMAVDKGYVYLQVLRFGRFLFVCVHVGI